MQNPPFDGLLLFAHCLFDEVSQAIWELLDNRIIDPFFMVYDTLATKTVIWAVGLGTRAINIYIFPNRALNNFFFHIRISPKRNDTIALRFYKGPLMLIY